MSRQYVSKMHPPIKIHIKVYIDEFIILLSKSISIKAPSKQNQLPGIFLRGKWDLLVFLSPHQLKRVLQTCIIFSLAHQFGQLPTVNLRVLRWTYNFCSV